MLQRNDQWHQDRLGKVTASRIADMVARTKAGWGASRANYRAQLIVERLTGKVSESYTNGAMQHGIDTEDQAKAAYEFYTDRDITPVGFVPHSEIPMAGASPDGLVGDDGLVEFKCPQTATHISTLLGDAVEDRYHKQMQFQMACTGRQWCDFVSFDPRLPPEMQLWIKRVERDDKLIAELEKEAKVFLAEVEETLAKLVAKFPPMAEAAE